MSMKEKEWMALVLKLLNPGIAEADSNLKILQGERLPYALEIRGLTDESNQETTTLAYETDLLILENGKSGVMQPRLVIEGKLDSITTHGAITYSEKASTHKNVFPFLRYGILIGNRKHYPLPGRLFRHGAYFDFMLSWKAYEPEKYELERLLMI